jgi:hypothetical protein
MLMLSAETSLADSATWNFNANSGYWRDYLNWNPPPWPNGATDVATFNASTITDVFTTLGETIFLGGMVFNGNAFTISAADGAFVIGGSGITNNSGNIQNFVAGCGACGGSIAFIEGATAGVNTAFTALAGPGTNAGDIGFSGTSTADHGTFIANGGAASGDAGGEISFGDSATADHGTFTINGGAVSGASGCFMHFFNSSTAANGTFTVNGGLGGDHGIFVFHENSTAGNAVLIANGGTGYGGLGGTIGFVQDSTGGTARVEVFGNGTLSLQHNAPGVTIGSIEGTGNVFLGDFYYPSQHLTVGSNNMNTTFSGVIQDGGFNGSFTKIGSGILTFQGRPTNDYIANTVSLSLVSGSIINLNFTGAPDTIRSLIVNGVPQMPGVYGGPGSGAPNQLPEFAGTGTVQVTQAPHPPFFTGETALGNGWYYLQFANGTPFGYYSYLSDQSFIYHIDLGFEYLIDANDGQGGIYFYDFASSSFFYTSPSTFPDLYDFSLNAWLYYLPDVNNPGRYTQNPRWFFNFATGQWVTL